MRSDISFLSPTLSGRGLLPVFGNSRNLLVLLRNLVLLRAKRCVRLTEKNHVKNRSLQLELLVINGLIDKESTGTEKPTGRLEFAFE